MWEAEVKDLGVKIISGYKASLRLGYIRPCQEKKKKEKNYMDLGDVSPGKRSIMQAPQLEFNSQNPTKKKKNESGGVHL